MLVLEVRLCVQEPFLPWGRRKAPRRWHIVSLVRAQRVRCEEGPVGFAPAAPWDGDVPRAVRASCPRGIAAWGHTPLPPFFTESPIGSGSSHLSRHAPADSSPKSLQWTPIPWGTVSLSDSGVPHQRARVGLGTRVGAGNSCFSQATCDFGMRAHKPWMMAPGMG